MEVLTRAQVSSRFKTIYELGSGAFGRVEKVYDRVSNEVRAVKIIRKDDSAVDRNREVQLLRSLSHPNIVEFHESFEVDDDVGVVMEYCGNGNLASQKSRMTEAVLLAIVRDVASALCYVHRKNVIHFDVKPQNVLLSSIGEAKLADFGVSRRADSTAAGAGCAKPGTVMYMAPELLSGGRATSASDVWALGVTAFEMAVGVPIALTGAETFDEWFATHEAAFQGDGRRWSPHFTRLVRRMLAADPAKRISAEDILAVPQIADAPPTWLVFGDAAEPRSEIFWDD